MLLTIALLVVASVMILDLREQVGRRAEENARNILQVVGRDIARNVEVLDISIKGVLDGLARPEVMALAPEIRNLVLFDRSTTASRLGAFVVFDAEGVPRIDSAGPVPRQVRSIADREHFWTHRDRDRGLFISKPYRSLLAGRDVIGLSRRVSNPDGSFGGVVVASIELAYLSDLLEQLQLGDDAVVSLLRTDGSLIVRHGGGGTYDSGKSLVKSPIVQRMLGAKSGSFVERSQFDDVERLYNFDRLGDLPLVLSVNLSTREIYKDWRKKAWATGLALLAICALLIVMTAVLMKELRRRALAEGTLVAVNGELFRLSMTDPLTGLGNRRHFEEMLGREIGRAARNAGHVALLLLDVDYFKRFNDRYGHPEGDRALKAVAAVLRGCARRPADMAFRIGGEEFAVVLPDTRSSPALHVAERIRADIRALGKAHADAPGGFLTVSLGVSEIQNGDAKAAIARADAALYRSKREGRDRTSVNDRLAAVA